MNKIIISNYGSGLAIGLEGTKEFQEQQFNRFFNYGGASKNGELHEESENFSYFLSNEEDMVKALAAQIFVQYVMDGTSKNFKGNAKGMENEISAKAFAEFHSYEKEEFMSRRTNGPTVIGGVAQNGRAEVWEDDFKPAK